MIDERKSTHCMKRSSHSASRSAPKTPAFESVPYAADDAGEIRCICGRTEDDGFTIQCEVCFAWQHASCVGVGKTNIPEKFYCERCSPPLPAAGRAAAKVSVPAFSPTERLLVGDGRACIAIAAVSRAMTAAKTRRAQLFCASSLEMLQVQAVAANEASSIRPPSRVLFSTEAGCLFLRPVKTRGTNKRIVPPRLGVFSKVHFDPGAFVCEFTGELHVKDSFANVQPSLVQQSFVFFLPGIDVVVDARKHGNMSRFIRRSCRPNLSISLEVQPGAEFVAEKSKGDFACFSITLSAKNNIFEGDELLLPNDFDFGNRVFKYDCACGNPEFCLSSCMFGSFIFQEGGDSVASPSVLSRGIKRFKDAVAAESRSVFEYGVRQTAAEAAAAASNEEADFFEASHLQASEESPADGAALAPDEMGVVGAPEVVGEEEDAAEDDDGKNIDILTCVEDQEASIAAMSPAPSQLGPDDEHVEVDILEEEEDAEQHSLHAADCSVEKAESAAEEKVRVSFAEYMKQRKQATASSAADASMHEASDEEPGAIRPSSSSEDDDAEQTAETQADERRAASSDSSAASCESPRLPNEAPRRPASSRYEDDGRFTHRSPFERDAPRRRFGGPREFQPPRGFGTGDRLHHGPSFGRESGDFGYPPPPQPPSRYRNSKANKYSSSAPMSYPPPHRYSYGITTTSARNNSFYQSNHGYAYHPAENNAYFGDEGHSNNRFSPPLPPGRSQASFAQFPPSRNSSSSLQSSSSSSSSSFPAYPPRKNGNHSFPGSSSSSYKRRPPPPSVSYAHGPPSSNFHRGPPLPHSSYHTPNVHTEASASVPPPPPHRDFADGTSNHSHSGSSFYHSPQPSHSSHRNNSFSHNRPPSNR